MIMAAGRRGLARGCALSPPSDAGSDIGDVTREFLAVSPGISISRRRIGGEIEVGDRGEFSSRRVANGVVLSNYVFWLNCRW
jgi:hypothetical protein